ncbi:hypothetical protein C8Q78DRAFT_414121 [Trametes maxima]|nr:hypothetical protein C8Q78DRAFT_414121 [Trametes maxima]
MEGQRRDTRRRCSRLDSHKPRPPLRSSRQSRDVRASRWTCEGFEQPRCAACRARLPHVMFALPEPCVRVRRPRPNARARVFRGADVHEPEIHGRRRPLARLLFSVRAHSICGTSRLAIGREIAASAVRPLPRHTIVSAILAACFQQGPGLELRKHLRFTLGACDIPHIATPSRSCALGPLHPVTAWYCLRPGARRCCRFLLASTIQAHVAPPSPCTTAYERAVPTHNLPKCASETNETHVFCSLSDKPPSTRSISVSTNLHGHRELDHDLCVSATFLRLQRSPHSARNSCRAACGSPTSPRDASHPCSTVQQIQLHAP